MTTARPAGAQDARESRTATGATLPATPSVPARTVTRRPDDPIYHRDVQRRAVPVWSPDRLRTLTPSGDAAVNSTLLSMHSEPGDYVGGGQDRLYTVTDGTFSVSGTSNHIQLYFSNASDWWYLNFSAPNNTALAVRNYTGATRYPFNASTEPGIDIYGDGRGCNQQAGSFRVKQIVFGGSGQVIKFWATFEQHCEGGRPALTGEIRWNADVQVALSAPLAQHTLFGQPLSFDVQAVTDDSSVTTLSAAPIPTGATFTDHRNNSGTFSWTPGFDLIGSHTPVAFRAIKSAGVEDSATTEVIVDGMTSLTMDSEPGDYIGGGQHQSYSPSDGTFGGGGNKNHVSVSFSSATHYWYLDFQAPNGAPLAVGTYLNATRYPFNPANGAGLSVDGDGRGCNTLTGTFVIKQISFATNGSLASFRAAFEQHCEGGAAALTGEVRWNAAVAVDIKVPFARSVQQGSPLSFDVSATSFDGSPVTLSTGALPAGATFSDHGDNTGTLRWTPHFADIGRNPVIVFRGATAGGLSDSASTTVTVLGLTSLRMSSDPGDWIGNGQDYSFTPTDGPFTMTGDRRHISVQFQGSQYSYWSLDFASPAGVDLAVGTYTGATRYPFNSGTQPGLSVTGPGRGCNTVTGSFRIKQVTFNGAGTPTALQLTFEQHCEGGLPGLTGELRVNASVPMDMLLPGARTLSEGQALHLPVAAESFDGNAVALSALDLPQGASFVDHGDNTGAFDWTPAIHQLGDYVVRFRGDNGHGTADTVSSRIHVTGVTSLTVVSDSLDLVGQGGNYQLNTLDGTFTTTKNQLNGVSVTFRDSLYHQWSLDFAADSGLPLEVNVYNGAIGYPAAPDILPSLRIAQDYRSCYTLTGRFVVRGVTYAGQSDVPSFWATFEQHCSGASDGLRGEIRYNADVPLIVTAPRSLTLSENQRATFVVRGLAVPGAHVALSPSRIPRGATFKDNGDNSGTFDWLPGFDQQGPFAVSIVAFDGLGAVDSSRTLLFVKNTNRPPVAKAGGPYRAAPGVPIFFDGSASSDPDGDAITLQWDFGDGTHGLGTPLLHAYDAQGTYTVVLRVSDGLLSSVDSTLAIIGPQGPPSPAITSLVPSHAPVGANVSVFGRGFTGATAVSFNLKPAQFSLVSDSLLRTNVPAGATTGLLRVITGLGTAVSRDSFIVDPASPVAACPRRRSVWREHTSEWPASTLQLGQLSYSRDELTQILRNSHGESETDASLKLGAELIAAKFNVLIGVHAPEADRAIARADSAIGNRRIPFSLNEHGHGHGHGQSSGELFEDLTEDLRDFNRGRMTPGCRGPFAENEDAVDAGSADAVLPGGILISPNPFSGTSRLRFAVQRDSRVRIGVLDLQGREVRVLQSGMQSAGILDLEWDGRDGNGHVLESGVYFYRIEGNNAVTLKKIVMLR